MTRPILFIAGVALVAVTLSGPCFSQGVEQTMSLPSVDPEILVSGYRTSQLVGRIVVNEHYIPIGRIDDLIVTPNDKVPFVVLSVDGFFEFHDKYVVVPFSSIEIGDNRLILRGATRPSLELLPAFHYRS